MITKENIPAFVNYRILYEYLTKSKDYGVFLLPSKIEVFSIKEKERETDIITFLYVPCLETPPSLIGDLSRWYRTHGNRFQARRILKSALIYQNEMIWELCIKNAACKTTNIFSEICYVIDQYLGNLINELEDLT